MPVEPRGQTQVDADNVPAEGDNVELLEAPPRIPRKTMCSFVTACGSSRLRCACLVATGLALVGVFVFARADSRLSLHVALCASGVSPWTSSQRPPVQLVAHRGCEWPYPENSVSALLYGAKLLKFVELDVVLSSDGEVVLMHDETVERTSNGSGVVCHYSVNELQSLALLLPLRRPTPDSTPPSPIPCDDADGPGTGTPGCVYRIPTLEDVFRNLPDDTRYMVDAKVCHIDGVLSSSTKPEPCNPCAVLIARTKQLMLNYRVEASRTVFTSTDVQSLSAFADAFPQATFALSVDHHYAAHTAKQMVRLLDKYRFDSVAIYWGTAAVRPDLVSAIRLSRNAKTQRLRDVYAWTVRQETQARISLCAGVDSFIVADPALWSMHEMVRVSTCPGGRRYFSKCAQA
jgi:glycerophosphoryl diester phosphodiesterase